MTSLKQRIRQTLIELLRIDGIYPHEDNVIAYVERRLSEAGVPWQEDGFRNIVAKIPGQGESILLSTHLDIPEPQPDVRFIEEGDIIRSDGSGILGVDPKTGLAILIELLIDSVNTDHTTHAPIEVLLTRGEETGLLGAQAADYSLLSAKIGLVLDEDGPVTQVVTQAPAFVKLDLTCHGKIVHPREPENGINALNALTAAMTQIPCGYSTDGVTWNIGIMSAGTARNSVPGKASFNAELRSYDTQLVVSEAKRISETFSKTIESFGARCEIENVLEFEGYRLDQEHPLFRRLKNVFSEMSLQPNYFSTFGGSDANIFNSHGIRCVPIGSGYYNAHQYTEYADISVMVEIYDFIRRFLRS